MLRHKQCSSNRQVFTKCCTKLVLYGRRDKLSIQSNRHQTIGCEYDAKCPEYISDMLKEQDFKNNNTRVSDMSDEFEFDEDDSELDQLWFDPWEGQIELSNCDYLKNDLSLLDECEFDDDNEFRDNLRVLSPLEKRRKSLLRQTSLPVFNQPIYTLPSSNDDFHNTHTLFWNQKHLDGSGSSDDVSFTDYF